MKAEEFHDRHSAHALLSRTFRIVLPPPATFAHAVAVWPADLSPATTKVMTVGGQSGQLEAARHRSSSSSNASRSRTLTSGGKGIEAPTQRLLPPLAAQATVSDWLAQSYGVAEGPGAGLRSELLELLENCATALQAADDAAAVESSENLDGIEATTVESSSEEDDEESVEEEKAEATSVLAEGGADDKSVKAGSAASAEAGFEAGAEPSVEAGAIAADNGTAGTSEAVAASSEVQQGEGVAAAPTGEVKEGVKDEEEKEEADAGQAKDEPSKTKAKKNGKSKAESSPAVVPEAHVVPSLASLLRHDENSNGSEANESNHGNGSSGSKDKDSNEADVGKTTSLEAELKVLKQELSALQATQAARMAAVADNLLEQATLLSAEPKRVVTLAEDPAFAKFFKMLSMHIPKAAVRIMFFLFYCMRGHSAV